MRPLEPEEREGREMILDQIRYEERMALQTLPPDDPDVPTEIEAENERKLDEARRPN